MNAFNYSNYFDVNKNKLCTEANNTDGNSVDGGASGGGVSSGSCSTTRSGACSVRCGDCNSVRSTTSRRTTASRVKGDRSKRTPTTTTTSSNDYSDRDELASEHAEDSVDHRDGVLIITSCSSDQVIDFSKKYSDTDSIVGQQQTQLDDTNNEDVNEEDEMTDFSRKYAEIGQFSDTICGITVLDNDDDEKTANMNAHDDDIVKSNYLNESNQNTSNEECVTTPLMFSRTSPIGSLPELDIDNDDNNSDTQSIRSQVSQRSAFTSYSDLPDSPGHRSPRINNPYMQPSPYVHYPPPVTHHPPNFGNLMMAGHPQYAHLRPPLFHHPQYAPPYTQPHSSMFAYPNQPNEYDHYYAQNQNNFISANMNYASRMADNQARNYSKMMTRTSIANSSPQLHHNHPLNSNERFISVVNDDDDEEEEDEEEQDDDDEDEEGGEEEEDDDEEERYGQLDGNISIQSSYSRERYDYARYNSSKNTDDEDDEHEPSPIQVLHRNSDADDDKKSTSSSLSDDADVNEAEILQNCLEYGRPKLISSNDSLNEDEVIGDINLNERDILEQCLCAAARKVNLD